MSSAFSVPPKESPSNVAQSGKTRSRTKTAAGRDQVESVRRAGGSLPHDVTALLWLRRDLRVSDNPALIASLQSAAHVIPVYIWAPEEEGQFQPGRCSRWWLRNSLDALEQDLKALGSRIVFRSAPESRTALLQLVQETNAKALFFNHLYDPISMVRDNEVKTAMASCGVACHTFNGDVLFEPWELLSSTGQPLANFNDYWERVNSMPYAPPAPLPVPSCMPPVDPTVVGLDLSELGLLSSEEENSNQQLKFTWQPGGWGAHLVLEEFLVNRLIHFSSNRAKADVRSTSRLSPHVHYGEISMRHIFFVVKQRESTFQHTAEATAVHTSCSDFLKQTGYREYSRYLSFHFPFTHERPLLQHLRACPWRLDQGAFKAWRQGRTGYPLVDAGLRELWGTGWMHNRMRVVCASFLVKNLLLPWQWGLKHYWDAQLDADLECAALGWQYCSGCLSDAHPFSYMVDCTKEALQFDPSGNYVRRWLPVLSRLPNTWIHRPHEAPAEVLQDAGVELGANYEWPIISLQTSKRHVAHACSVMDRCLTAPSAPGSEQTAPYRVPTAPGFDAYHPMNVGSDEKGFKMAGDAGDVYSSDEEVFSNIVATAPRQSRTVMSHAISGAVSRAPPGRTADAAAAAASEGPEDDTFTMKGAFPGKSPNDKETDCASSGSSPPSPGPSQDCRRGAARSGNSEGPLQKAALDIIPDGHTVVSDIAAQEASSAQLAAVKVVRSLHEADNQASAKATAAAATHGAAPSYKDHDVKPPGTKPDRRGYSASWSDAEVEAHASGNLSLFRELQAQRLTEEMQMADSFSQRRSGQPSVDTAQLPRAVRAAAEVTSGVAKSTCPGVTVAEPPAAKRKRPVDS